MIFPDYENSIVNLMSSILNSFGVSAEYPEIKLLPSKQLIPYKNIILFVIDGLGYHFLKEEIDSSIIKEQFLGRMSSVFPATTASAITTFLTGLPPSRHGITGWNMWLKELGVISTVLPFTARMGVSLRAPFDLDRKVFTETSIFEKIRSQTYSILPKKISSSAFSTKYSGNSKKVLINQVDEIAKAMVKIVKENQQKKYIYAYWHQYDHLSHTYGYNSETAKNHVTMIINLLMNLRHNLEGTSTKLIVTADHGFINTEKEKIIELKNHPELSNCLTMPLCGESRAAYCYVRANKKEQFENYIKAHFAGQFECYLAEELLSMGVLGPTPYHKNLDSRIGDYILLAKENYILKDLLLTEEMLYFPGRHGGCTEQEMYVPLLVFDF